MLSTRVLHFRMKMGQMFVDYKLTSRDHKKSIYVEECLVDPLMAFSVAPMSWLEALRSPTARLPSGYFTEETVYVPPKNTGATFRHGAIIQTDGKKSKTAKIGGLRSMPAQVGGSVAPNAVKAGPVVLYIVGQPAPVVLDIHFVDEPTWVDLGGGKELDLRLGVDAIEQCQLFNELRPGGLLAEKPVDELRKYGMKCNLAESPLVARPWTKMKTMSIDELQRGPELTEFVGYNPRNGTPWRFSQNNKYFRIGIWRELTRKNDMHEGLHIHSSWQKSPQQSVPGVRFLAP